MFSPLPSQLVLAHSLLPGHTENNMNATTATTYKIKWHPMTAYLFEPSAHSAVRNAHQARIDGDQHHPFVDSDNGHAVEDCDKTIPPGTQVVVRPRFPRVSTTFAKTGARLADRQQSLPGWHLSPFATPVGV